MRLSFAGFRSASAALIFFFQYSSLRLTLMLMTDPSRETPAKSPFVME